MERGERLRSKGQEYGATTGRPRRCGWFDAVAARYSAMINSLEKIAFAKLDVLDDFDKIKVCMGYEYNGKRLKTFPTDVKTLEHVTPIYETFEGWKSQLSDITTYSHLPPKAQRYVEGLAHLTGTPIWIVSLGARRDQTIVVS